MSKTMRIPAFILALMLIMQLFPAKALATEELIPGVNFLPKLYYSYTDETGVYDTSEGKVFKAQVIYAFSMDPVEIARVFKEDKPVLCLWTYAGDSLLYEEVSLAEKPLIYGDEYVYVQVVYPLDASEGIYTELMLGNGWYCWDEEWNFGGWRPQKFDDVTRDKWYYSSVNRATNILGLLGGKGNNKFAPDDNISYAEAITLAARMYERSIGPSMSFLPQPDTGAKWYQPYVDFAREKGFPWSYPDYNAGITRAELAHIFYAALKHLPEIYYKEINNVANGSIPDVPMTHKYASEIYTLYRAGILSGSDAERSFRPDTTIRRSEVATILSRSFGEGRQEFSLG